MITDKNILKAVEVPDVDLFSDEELKRHMKANPETFRRVKKAASPSTSFWKDKPLGRTLTGRNKAGRVVRKIGFAALSFAGGMLGLDVGGALDTGRDLAELEAILHTIETIAWIVAGIVGTLAGGSDYIEIKGERYDEQEILEGKIPMARKLKSKMKGTT